MNYKIGIFGSSVDEGKDITEKAILVGNILAEYKNLILITGAGKGIPYIVAKTAADKGVKIWGFPPVIDSSTQKTYAGEDDVSFYTKILYVPKITPFHTSVDASRQYRNLQATFTSDAGIIIAGRWGTLNEFTNLFGMGKIIGILTETGGIADELKSLLKKINKPTQADIIFDDDPNRLIQRIFASLTKRNGK